MLAVVLLCFAAFLSCAISLRALRSVVCGYVSGAVVCTCAVTQGNGVGHKGMLCCLRLCLCSISYNFMSIGDEGGTAGAAVLGRLTQLQTLKYVVCPAVCGGLRCVLAWEIGARGAFGLAFLCLRLVFVQHFQQLHR